MIRHQISLFIVIIFEIYIFIVNASTYDVICLTKEGPVLPNYACFSEESDIPILTCVLSKKMLIIQRFNNNREIHLVRKEM
jgi:hypothetical protein